MPNRIIQERICTSETLADLTADEERFFYRLMVQCDDYGRFDGRVSVVRARCFPLQIDTIADTDVERWLSRLVAVGLIKPYSVDGRKFLQMVTWDRYQQTRAKTSKYPPPPSDDDHPQSNVSNGNHVIADESGRSQIPSYPEARSEKREAIHEVVVDVVAPSRHAGSSGTADQSQEIVRDTAQEPPWVFCLSNLTEPSRGFLGAFRAAYGSKRPLKLNRTHVAQLEEAVLDLGPERLEESAVWAASQGLDYGGGSVIKAIRAARTKRQKDEDHEFSQERSTNGRSHPTRSRAGRAQSADPRLSVFRQFDS